MWWLLKPLVYFPGLLLAGVVPLAAVFLGWVGGGSRHKVLVTFILLGLLTGLVWRPTTSAITCRPRPATSGFWLMRTMSPVL